MTEADSRAQRLAAGEALLFEIASRVEVEVRPEDLRALGARLDAREDDATWPEAVRHACEPLGLHCQLSRGTVAQAVAAVGPAHPVVAWEPDGDWLLLTVRGGGWVEAERPSADGPERLSRAALAALLDPSSGGSIDWVAVDPPGLLRGSRSAFEPAQPTDPWTRLRTLMVQERQDIAVAFVYAVGVGLLTLASPVAVQALVNTVAFGTLLQPLAVLTALLLTGLVFAGVLRALQAWVVEILQRRLFVRLVNELSFRLPRVDLQAFDQAHGPELVNRFFDLFTIQKASATLLVGGLELFLTALVGMLVLAFYHPLLLAFDAVLLCVVVGILVGLGRGATYSAVQESKAKYEVAGWLEEVARHPLAFKLAGGPELARSRADQLAAAYLSKRQAHYKIVFRQLVGALALQAFASAGILGIGGWLVIERQLTLGQLVAAELIVTLVVASFAKVGKKLETSYDLLAALDKVGQLVDLPLEPARFGAASSEALGGDSAQVEARNIGFRFPGREAVFTNVDLEIQAGEHMVLAGTSGSGRSALVEVLLGLRPPTSGWITLDGVDLDDLDRDRLRRRTALVRGNALIAGSVADNVAFGRTEVDGTRLRDALRAVGLIEEVAKLPDGLATRIMPDGAPLSTGQALRLVLARAIAGRPSLLVVDGMLDGLDPATQATVCEAIFGPNVPWTVGVISDDPVIQARCTAHLSLVDGVLSKHLPRNEVLRG